MTNAHNCIRRPAQAGYNLIEMMFVLGIMGVLSGMAVLQIGASRPGAVGDGAMRMLLGQMNAARELAITQRRYMGVVFTAPNLMQIVPEDPLLPTLSVLLEGGVQFAFVSGVTYTSDQFFTSTAPSVAIGFGTVKFSPEGKLVNQAGATANGMVFLGLPNQALSSRAVEIVGSTGRVRGYKWDGAKWNVV